MRKFGLMYPGLQTLILANNKLSSIDEPQESLCRLFPQLRCINLHNTGMMGAHTHARTHARTLEFLLTFLVFIQGLSRWEDIEKLSMFPKLQEVKVMGVPLLQSYGTTERRSLVVAQ